MADRDAFKRLLHPNTIDAGTLRVVWSRFSNIALSALLTSNSDLAKEAYWRAQMAPRTQTTVDLRSIGIEMNGTLHGSETECLHIGFVETVPKAVKIIDKDESLRAESFLEAGFQVSMVADHDHTNHVINFRLCRAHGNYLTVMPLLPTTLEHITQLSVRGAAQLLQQMIRALSFIHSLGFAHMDVKPANICINGRGDFVLADLGSMAKLGESTKSTMPYLPSDLQSLRMVSRANVDFWMLAMTLGERLCKLEIGEAATEPSREVLLGRLNADKNARQIIGDLIAHLELET